MRNPFFDELGEGIEQFKETSSKGSYYNDNCECDSKFNSVFENANDSIVFFDKRGIIQEVNVKGLELIGGDRVEIIGNHFKDIGIFSHKDLPQISNYFNDLVAGNKETIELCIKNLKGDVKYIRSTGFVIKKDGRITGVMVITKDITDRLQAIDDLKEIEKRTQTLLDAMPDMIFHIDKEGYILNYNGKKENLYFSPDDFLGKNLKDLFSSKIAKSTMQNIENAVQCGNMQTYEYSYVIEGVQKFFESRVVPNNNSTVTVVIRDVTESKLSEQTINNNKRLLNETQKMAKVGGWEIDIKTNLGLWTEETYRIHEINPADIDPNSHEFYQRSLDCYEEDDQKILKEALKDCIEIGVPYDFEFPFKTEKGTRLWIRTTAKAEKENGKIVKVVGNIIDITEQKRAEMQKKAMLHISQAAITTENLKELFSEIHQALSSVVDTTNFYIAIHELGSEKITFPYFVDECDDNNGPLDLKESKSGTSLVILSGNPIIKKQNDYEKMIDDGELILYGSHPKVWLGIPLKTKNRTIGALVVQSYTDENLYSQNDIPFLQVIADIAAHAIERKRTEEELKCRNRIEEAIANASGLFFSSEEVNYNKILNILGDSVSANRAYIFQFHKSKNLLEYKFEWCSPGTGPQINEFKNLKATLLPWWMEQLYREEYFVIRDVTKIPNNAIEEKNILLAQQIKSLVVIPIWLRGKDLWGFMGFDDTEMTREWNQNEIKALKIVGEMISGDLERRIYKKKLESEHAQLLSIFDSIDETIYVADPYSYEILYVNKTVKKSFKKDLIGGLCYKEFQGLDSPCEFCSNYIILKQKPKPFHWEYHNPILKRDFSIIDRIIKWPDNRDVRFELAIDVTDLKKAANEKRTLEEQLFQVQKMESIGRLAGGLAHDFNNILASIMGYAEMLKLRFPNTQSSEGEAAKIIIKGAERASNLTKQLLGFARAGRFNPVPLNLNKLISEIVEVSEKIFKKKIKVSFDFEKELKTIEGDKGQLDQVITNLIINSNDAMPDGGEIFFKTENVVNKDINKSEFPEINDGPYVKISIRDTGIGIPKDIMENIFDPFFTTKKEGHGTGLGLATVYGIAKNHEGFIKVYSEVGKGSTFNLYFPASEKLEIKRDEKSNIIKGKATILIVDDEEYIRNLLAKILKDLGYKIFLAENGKEAIKIFEKNQNNIDLVLLDIVMPEMSCNDTLLSLKKIKPEINIILISGYAKEEEAIELMRNGAIDFIQKPFSLENLSLTISKGLKVVST